MFDYVKKMATEAHANIVEIANNVSAELLQEDEEPSTSGENHDNADSVQKVKCGTTHVMEALDRATKLLPPTTTDDVFINLIAKLLKEVTSNDNLVKKWLVAYQQWIEDDDAESFEALQNVSNTLAKKQSKIVSKSPEKVKKAESFEFESWGDDDPSSTADHSEVFKLSSDLAEKSEVISSLEEENRMANVTIEQQKKDIKQLVEELKQLQVLLHQAEDDKDAETAKNNELNQKIESLSSSLGDNKLICEQIGNEFEALKIKCSEIDAVRLEVAKLTEQLEEKERLIAELMMEEGDHGSDTLEKYKEELAAQGELLQCQRLEIVETRQNAAELSQALVEKHAIIESLTADLKASQASNDELAMQMRQSSDNMGLTTLVDERTAIIEALTADLAASKEEFADKVQVSEHKITELSNLLSEKIAIIESLSADLAASKEEFADKVQVSEHKITELSNLLSEKITIIKSLTADLEASKEELADKVQESEHKISELSNLLSDKIAIIESLSADLKASKEELVNKVQVSEHNISESSNLLSEKIAIIKSLTADLEESKEEQVKSAHVSRQEIVKLSNELAGKDVSIGQLMTDLKASKEELVNKVQVSEHKINELSNLLSEKIAIIKSLTADLEASKEELADKVQVSEHNISELSNLLSEKIATIESLSADLEASKDEQVKSAHVSRQEIVKLSNELAGKDVIIGQLTTELAESAQELEINVRTNEESCEKFMAVSNAEKLAIVNSMDTDLETAKKELERQLQSVLPNGSEDDPLTLEKVVELVGLESKYKDLLADFEKMVHEKVKMETQLEEQLNLLKSESVKLMTELSALSDAETVNEREYCRDLEKDVQRLKGIETLYYSLSREVETLKRDLQLEQASAYSANETNQKLNQHITKLKEALTEKEIEITEMAAEISTTEYDKNQARTDNSTEMDDLRRACSFANDEIDRLKKMWNESRQHLEDNKKALEQKGKLLDQITSEKHEAERKLNALREDHTQLKTDFERVNAGDKNKNSEESSQMKKKFSELEFSLELIKGHIKRIYYDESVPDQNFGILMNILGFDHKTSDVMIQTFNRYQGKRQGGHTGPGFLNEFESFIDSSITNTQMQLSPAPQAAFSMSIDEPVHVPDEDDEESIDGIL